MSDDGMYLYHIGIIDYLQDFNVWKKGENLIKGMLGQDKHQISAVPSAEYGERFFQFMKKFVINN
jgi:1-phosphatidylinositol-4-phosphate 5-kinase